MKTNAIAIALMLAGLTTAQAQNTPTPQAPTVSADGNTPDRSRPDGRRLADMGPGGPGKHKGNRRQDFFGPEGGPGRQGPDGGRKGRSKGRQHGLLPLTTMTGTVGQLTGNDDYILNGFTLTGANSASAVNVTFPAHLGQQVQKAVKAGSTVSVTGFSDATPRGETRFHMTSLTSGKTTIVDAPPAIPPTPATPVMTTTSGKIADYKFDRGGRVNGLVLSDNSIVRIPPHVAYQLTNLAQKGADITVQGYTRTLGEGQVQLQKATILRASVLTINGQQYLVR